MFGLMAFTAVALSTLPGFDHLLPHTTPLLLDAVIGRPLKVDKAVSAAFKAYDACSLPLVDLVDVLAGVADAGVFAKATFEEMHVVGVDTVSCVL